MKRTSVIGIWILVLLLLCTSCTGENAGMPEMSDQAAAAPETGGTEDMGETEEPTPDAEPAQAPYLPGWDEEVPSLCETYDGVFRVGAAVNTAQLREGTDFYRLITRHYNTFVTENEMKPMYLNPSEGTFCFDAADRFVEFGEENDVLLRGHTLVWHSQAPAWWFLG